MKFTPDLFFCSLDRSAEAVSLLSMLDSTGNFTGTQTPGTNVHMARGTIDNRLYALDIGFPRAVGTPVGVGNLDPEGNARVTELTLSHPLHLLAVSEIMGS